MLRLKSAKLNESIKLLKEDFYFYGLDTNFAEQIIEVIINETTKNKISKTIGIGGIPSSFLFYNSEITFDADNLENFFRGQVVCIDNEWKIVWGIYPESIEVVKNSRKYNAKDMLWAIKGLRGDFRLFTGANDYPLCALGPALISDKLIHKKIYENINSYTSLNTAFIYHGELGFGVFSMPYAFENFNFWLNTPIGNIELNNCLYSYGKLKKLLINGEVNKLMSIACSLPIVNKFSTHDLFGMLTEKILSS